MFLADDTLIKPNYDVSSYGRDKVIPLTTDTLLLEPIIWSELSELIQISPNNAGVDSFLEDYPEVISNVDTLGILNEGEGVPYSRTFEWLTDMTAWVYKFNLSFAMAIAVTSWTSGNISIDSVKCTLSERRADGKLVKIIGTFVKATGMSTITSAVNAVIIMHIEGNTPFKISVGNILRLQIEFTTTNGDATTFEGIMPYFFFQKGNLSKSLSKSALILHLHPALDHAYPIFRDQSLTDKLDYSGVNRSGIPRERGIVP